ncbi:MAG: winged helix-turn-helix transcriptional regulator, partial [Eubacterium sp.]|nr:winged helix-turn-helix transcriptional regulator [Eubacterium sp.]
MLTYDLSEDSGLSLYEQLYNHIKQDILSGNISANEKLPSKRNLAKQLSISVMTVENSYNQLLSEGFIYSLPRKGFY